MNSLSKAEITNIKESPIATTLKAQIKSRIEAMDTNVRALERRAGLNVGTVNNILHGASSNPTAETLIALANAFDCSIDDLLARRTKESNEQDSNLQSFQPFKWNHDLFSSITSELNRQLKDRNISVSSDKALMIAQEVYLYSLKKNKEHADESLVEWLLDKSL